MATIATYKSHVSRAISFYNDTPNIFFAIGRTTEWQNEDLPPDPSLEAVNLDNVISGFKRPNAMKFVVPDPVLGTLIVDGVRWREVVPDTITYSDDTIEAAALRVNARWIYMDVILEEDEFVNVTYRQIGIYSRGILASGVSDALDSYNLTDFDDVGILEVYQNRKPIHRQSDQREQISFVIEF